MSELTVIDMRNTVFRTESTLGALPKKGDVIAWSAPAQKWTKINVRYVRNGPEIYTRWHFDCQKKKAPVVSRGSGCRE